MFIMIGIIYVFIAGLSSSEASNVTFKMVSGDARFTGLVLDSGYIRQSQLAGNDKIACGTSCISMPDCVSFFLDTGTSQCQFHDTVLHNTTGLAMSANSLYFIVGTVCQPDWVEFASSCFFFETVANTNYDEAKAVCEQMGAKILRVNTAEESQFIKEYLQENSYTSHKFWLGLTDEQSHGTWIWEETGLEATFTDWAYSQPQMNSEHCAAIFIGLQWHDVTCTAQLHAACRIP